MSNGIRSSRCCRRSGGRPPVGDAGLMIDGALQAFSGCFVQARAGRICPGSIHRRAPAGGVCVTGKTRASGSTSGVNSWANLMTRGGSTGRKPLPTAALPRQKKGRLRRQDQTRKGYEVDGGGKRPRSSSGSSTCLREPARGDVDRIDIGESVGAATTWPTTKKSQTIDLRQGGRLGSVAQTLETARHRFDLSAQVEPREAADAGRTKTAAIQAPLEDGTQHRLGWKLQKIGGPI